MCQAYRYQLVRMQRWPSKFSRLFLVQVGLCGKDGSLGGLVLCWVKGWVVIFPLLGDSFRHKNARFVDITRCWGPIYGLSCERQGQADVRLVHLLIFIRYLVARALLTTIMVLAVDFEYLRCCVWHRLDCIEFSALFWMGWSSSMMILLVRFLERRLKDLSSWMLSLDNAAWCAWDNNFALILSYLVHESLILLADHVRGPQAQLLQIVHHGSFASAAVRSTDFLGHLKLFRFLCYLQMPIDETLNDLVYSLKGRHDSYSILQT